MGKEHVFTEDEVASINSFQNWGDWYPRYPLTCGNEQYRQVLVATANGLVCPDCDYTQDWVPDFMRNGEWKRANDERKRIECRHERWGKFMHEIMDERDRQDAKWGGPEHDDKHDYADWYYLIAEHNYLAVQRGKDVLYSLFRKQMIRVAALAIAAIESADRLESKSDNKGDNPEQAT